MKQILILAILLILSGCAAGIAMTSQKAPNIEDIGIGATQAEVESMLGLRVKTIIINRKRRIDFYRYKAGGAPSMSRGMMHATMSAGSGGWWDVLGVPFEQYNNREKILAVTYDENNIAIDVREMNMLQPYEK